MRGRALLAGLLLAAMLLGCGKGLQGTWVAKVRADPTKPQTPLPGTTLEEVQRKLETTARRTLELQPGGKYRETFGENYNLGTWRVEGDTLYLNATNFNGNAISRTLQVEKPLRIARGGKEILTTTQSAYGLEEYLVRE